MERLFRPCVLGVISNHEGKVLIAERSEPRGAWQFPQGGIDAGETPEEAIRREIFEELHISSIEIVGRSQESVRYEFPAEMVGGIAQKYRGQDQIWFHLRCAPGVLPDLAKAADKEFVAYTWVSIQDALDRIVDFKKSAYRRGLELLGLVPKD